MEHGRVDKISFFLFCFTRKKSSLFSVNLTEMVRGRDNNMEVEIEYK